MTRRLRTFVVSGAVAAIVAAANGSEGAYFSQSWGWVALAFLIPTTLLVILERAALPGRLRASFALAMGALAGWIALSSIWSLSTAASLREEERMLVYLAVALAVAIVFRRGDGPGVAAGALVGIVLVSGYALGTRLFPDRLHTEPDPTVSYRLAEPLGYWNALGLFAAMGMLLALGFTAHCRRVRWSVASGMALPILAATLYFTFSRGAWGALAFGFAGMAALDPRRLRLLWVSLLVSPACVAGVALASRQRALTTEDSPVGEAVRQGHRLAPFILALALLAGCLAWIGRRIAARAVVPPRGRRVADAVLALGVLVGAVVALVAAGGPSRAASELRDRFEADPVAGVDLNARLFSVSGNGRAESIGVALHAARERPLLGYGAGSYEYLWYERRTRPFVIRDAHSLYGETSSELGVVGLLLLLVAVLAVPLVAAVRARRSRFVAAGTGALLAWAGASALDWHWEMVGVTLTALLAGSAGLLATERGRARPLTGVSRGVVLTVSVASSVAAVVSLVGNQALFAGREALARKDWVAARDDARRAEALLPWSYEPYLVLGDAAAGLGDRPGAIRAYRDAVSTDRRNWVAWLRLAQVARGAERAHAYAEVHRLDPLERDLPGESSSTSD